MQPHPLGFFGGKIWTNFDKLHLLNYLLQSDNNLHKLIFDAIWAKFKQIWANLIRFRAKSKSCIHKNIRSPTIKLLFITVN